MITRENLPPGYESYRDLNVCSNKLINGGFLLEVGKALPLVIGVGAPPKIWLQAAANPQASEFVEIVRRSVALHPMVHIATEHNRLIITVANTVVLDIKSENPESAVINVLDLRPIGFNVFGADGKLVAGGMHFSKSTFSGGGALIGMPISA